MTIEINLSPEKEGDWLERATSGDSVDIWDRLDDDERKRRATDAQVRALTEELAARGLSTERATTLGRWVYENLTNEQFREIRKAALNRKSDEDYVDRVASVIADGVQEFLLRRLLARQLAEQRRSSNTVSFERGTPDLYTPAAGGPPASSAILSAVAALHAVQGQRGSELSRTALGRSVLPTLPVVEIPDEVIRLTADYSGTLGADYFLRTE